MTDSDEHVLSDGGQLADTDDHGGHVADTMSANPVHVFATDMLARYEAATMRLGWVEGQLDMTRRMLTDGGQREAELKAEAERERQARLHAEAEAQLRAEAAERRERELAAELAAARTKLEALEQRKPWWRKLLSG